MTLEKPQQLKDIDTIKQDIVNLSNNKAEKNTVYSKTEIDNNNYTKTQTDNLLKYKADKANTYIKSEIDNSMANKTNNIVGQVIYVATPTAPNGWLKCNGSAVSRTTYADLFNAIGTTFGSGDGTTTFNLPDLRGEFIRGWDDGRGVDAGRTLGSKQNQDIQSHNHTANFYTNANAVGSAYLGSSQYNTLWNENKFATENTGGTETRPRNVALLVCIKY